MAVLARTYVLNAPGKYGPDYDLVDDTRSQVYRGEEAIIPLALEAARSTEGEVLTYRGKPIQAVYHSSSGGHTADNESVWASASVPYLRGKSDPYGKQSPHAEWVSRVARPKLLSELGKKVRRGSRWIPDGRAQSGWSCRLGLPAHAKRAAAFRHRK